MSLAIAKSRARVPCTHQQRRSVLAPARLVRVSAAAADKATVDEGILSQLKAAVKKPGSVPGSAMLKSMLDLEKQKAKPEGWEDKIAAPTHRWRLMYTIPSKDVTAASKKGAQPKGVGSYFPIAACQKFDANELTFENGVFFGGLFHLTFKGPYTMTGRNLYFDVCTMSVGLGPARFSIPLKKADACKPLAQRDPKEVKKLPFFVYAWADDDIIVARGRSGGVALWGRADTEWQARTGVLTVYK